VLGLCSIRAMASSAPSVVAALQVWAARVAAFGVTLRLRLPHLATPEPYGLHPPRKRPDLWT